jgi:uncharacterized protein YecA (UPF0149 family)
VGVIAEAVAAYAQPLIDETDGSLDSMNRALTIAQACWNLALLPEGQRETAIADLQPALDMTDEQFAEFRETIVLPMIRRHREMFPGMHSHSRQTSNTFDFASAPTQKHAGTGRNSPCPCGSGRKYKVCCGARK